MTPVKGPSGFLVVPVVTVTFDDGYAVATVFPPAMPATVMNAVLCARTSIFAIVTTIVAAIAIISVIAYVNANALGAHNARRCYRENSSTNKSNFLHSYLQIKAQALNGTHGKPFRDLLPLFPERMFILFKRKAAKSGLSLKSTNALSMQVADQIDSAADNENRRYGPQYEYGHIFLLHRTGRNLATAGLFRLTN